MSENVFLETKWVGSPVKPGTSAPRYGAFLTSQEQVVMEFKGMRDALVLTNLRMIVIDPQGLRGKKVAIHSIPWKSISAFSLENSGTFDLDSELKVCGSGFDICEVQFARGVDVTEVARLLNHYILGEE